MKREVITQIIHDISLRNKLDKRVIREISFHPLLFFKRKAETGDNRSVRIMYWGVFAPKTGRQSKENAMKYIFEQLVKNMDDVFAALDIEDYSIYDTKDKLEKAIINKYQEKDKRFLDRLWKLYKEYLKNN